MAKYIDLVAVRFEQYHDLLVVQAPWCSPIKNGMTVLCETSQGEELGKVISYFEEKTLDYDD